MLVRTLWIYTTVPGIREEYQPVLVVVREDDIPPNELVVGTVETVRKTKMAKVAELKTTRWIIDLQFQNSLLYLSSNAFIWYQSDLKLHNFYLQASLWRTWRSSAIDARSSAKEADVKI